MQSFEDMRPLVRRAIWQSSCVGAAVLVAAALLAAACPAAAEPLAKDACDGLKAEQDALAAAGIKDDLARGPAWGRTNLKPDRLVQVARYIDLEEQLLFRCGLAKTRYPLPPEPESTVAPQSEQATAKAKAKSRPKPKPKAAADPAASGAGKDEAPPSKRAGAQIVPAKTVQAKPKPKPKVDDAYRPPAPATKSPE